MEFVPVSVGSLALLLLCVPHAPTGIHCFNTGFHAHPARGHNLNANNLLYRTVSGGRATVSPFRLHSRGSVETVIHTDDYFLYDPNSIKYRKAKYWREKSNEEIQEQLRITRKVLRKIEECIKIKDPSLLPDSKRNAKRTQAQLLYLLHERHLDSLRNKAKIPEEADRTPN